LDLPLGIFRPLERLDRVTQPLARDRAAHLLERAVRPLNLALNTFEVQSGARHNGSRYCDFGLGHDPLRDWHRGMPIRRVSKLVLGYREVLGVALSLQCVPSTDFRCVL